MVNNEKMFSIMMMNILQNRKIILSTHKILTAVHLNDKSGNKHLKTIEKTIKHTEEMLETLEAAIND